MSLDNELEIMEENGETEAEYIDQQTELEDVENDIDELLDADAMESDLEHSYDSFITNNETDYDGYDPSEIADEEARIHAANVENSEGYHIEDSHDLEEEVIEMEIEDGDIHAYLVDEDDNEIGFILLDENGEEQEYYYVNMDEYEIVDDGSDPQPETKVIRADDGEEFDLGITREGIAEATSDVNAIYKEGTEVIAELKDTFNEINEGFDFLKKRR